MQVAVVELDTQVVLVVTVAVEMVGATQALRKLQQLEQLILEAVAEEMDSQGEIRVCQAVPT
jgi:hypothetical protein